MADNCIPRGVAVEVIALFLLIDCIDSAVLGVIEYCQFESFHADCAAGEVIVAESARYGRMRLGRCVKRDLGFVGCYADVLTDIDHLCSGRQNCQVRVPDLAARVEGRLSCMAELKSYLEVSYKCLPVFTPTVNKCRPTKPHLIRNTTGLVSSVTTYLTGCGGRSNPWILQAKAGQTINITLLDFSRQHVPRLPPKPTNQWRGEQEETGTDVRRCDVAYAVIKEVGTKEVKTVCGGQKRLSHIYTSVGNRVEIRVMDGGVGQRKYFVLGYEAHGCSDPNWTDPYTLQRRGDVTIVTCPSSGQSYRILCSSLDSKWVGNVGNCTKVEEEDNSYGFKLIMGSISISTEVSIVLVLAIACVIGICILLTGLCYIKRRKRGSGSDDQQMTAAPYGPAPPYESGTNPRDAFKRVDTHFGKHYCAMGINEYAYITDCAHAQALSSFHPIRKDRKMLNAQAQGSNDFPCDPLVGAYCSEEYTSESTSEKSSSDSPNMAVDSKYFDTDSDFPSPLAVRPRNCVVHVFKNT